MICAIQTSPLVRYLLIALAVTIAAGGPVRAQAANDEFPIGTTPAQRLAAIHMMRERSFEIKGVYWAENNKVQLLVVDHNRSVEHLAKYACTVARQFGVADRLFVYVYDVIRLSYFAEQKLLTLLDCLPWD